MGNREQKTASFRLGEADPKTAVDNIAELLDRSDVTREASSDTKLIFEALLRELSNQGFGEDTVIEVSTRKQLDGLCLVVGFEGKVFSPPSGDDGNRERFILCSLGDKINYSYGAGYNSVRITITRSYRNSFFLCALAAVLALVAFLPIHFLVSPADQNALLDGYVVPLERLYVNAILMVGAPMTLFSLLKNITDTYIVSERHSSIRRLQRKTLTSSALAIVLALVVGYLLQVCLSELAGYESELGGRSPNMSFAEIVPDLVPSGIFQPFDKLSPIPLIALSLLVAYALCSVGKYFDAMRKAVDACYALFSRMLYAVISTLPIFCFVAMMDVLLDTGFFGFADVVGYLTIAALSPLVLLVTYAVRLRVRGIKVIPFAKKVFPLLRENFKIGSAITAAPLNIRYCDVSTGALAMVIYAEAFLGSLQNLINVTGDIVMAAVEESCSASQATSEETPH